MVPGEVPDREYDSVEVPPNEVIERHIKLSHRTELVLMALRHAGLPFSRLTREALEMAADALENVCEAHDMSLDE